MSTLEATRSVLDLEEVPQEPLAGQSVRFCPVEDDGSDGWNRRTVTFSAEDWDAMGRPDQVTVEVVPGDTLNP